MANTEISYQTIVEKLKDFQQARSWVGLDSADLAKSIVLEAAELLEHYQWDGTAIKRHGQAKDKNKDKIASEAADIFIYLLGFCAENKIDLLEATYNKIEHNANKYKVETMKNGGEQAYLKAKQDYRQNH